MESKPPLFTTHYIKNHDFRTVLSQGVFGGVTPQGQINANFYIERAPIPTTMSYGVDQKGNIGQEVSRETKEGIIREVQVGILMDLNVALAFRDWLNKSIETIQTLAK